MKFLRTIVIALAVISLAAFGYYKFQIDSKYDEVAPVIKADSDEITVSVTDGDDVLLQGMTASDNRDGDVTDSLIVESHSKFIAEGKRKVTYAAFDKAGNVGTYTRTIVYSDYTAPTFNLAAPLRVSLEGETFNPSSNITASDCLDGNITTMIKYKYGENTNFSTAGEYLISYQVSDSAGDTSVIEMYIEVMKKSDYEKPYPILTDYIVYTNVGEALNLTDYIKGLVVDNYYSYIFADHAADTEPEYTADQISISGDVDYNTPGTYRVIYTLNGVADEKGNTASYGSVSLYVVVR